MCYLTPWAAGCITHVLQLVTNKFSDFYKQHAGYISYYVCNKQKYIHHQAVFGNKV
jgi:hypothetical protein